ncbi:MAG: 4Fe-4S dicluster domain-containing protein [Phycisphaerales bacterium]
MTTRATRDNSPGDDRMSRRDLLSGGLLGGLLDSVADRMEQVGRKIDRVSKDIESPSRADPPPITSSSCFKSSMVARYPDPHGAPSPNRYPTTIPVHRPPGAIEESEFLAECTRCGDCIAACPYEAIVLAPDRFRVAAGTPVINPDRQPCWMCADRPCIDACEPGVLTREITPIMGTAQINPETCLAWSGPGCSVCIERCPVEGAIVTDRGRPRVVEDSCTGCGVCRYVCPAPSNAVLSMPALRRPSRPGEAERSAD